MWCHPTFSRLSETFCRSHPISEICRGTGASIFWLKNGRFSYRHWPIAFRAKPDRARATARFLGFKKSDLFLIKQGKGGHSLRGSLEGQRRGDKCPRPQLQELALLHQTNAPHERRRPAARDYHTETQGRA